MLESEGKKEVLKRIVAARAADQISERDWQPSTGTHAPLIQLACGET
jgi:hypothetical protein